MRAHILAACLLFSLPWAPSARAQTGVNDDRVSLPEGPGSLEGLGDNATINPNMGSMTFSIPIDAPAGFEKVTPQLSLSYSSAAGVGVSGIGWDLAVPYIERMTNWRLPAYDLDDDFVANGGQQLVRVAAEGAAPTYRARFESGFSRYRWHGAAAGAHGYWTEELANGVVRYYGAAPDGSLVPSARSQGRGDSTFRWQLVAEVDPYGHRAEYRYVELDGIPYLERVEYIFTVGAPSARILFEYGARADRISDARSGRNELRARRLVAVEVYDRAVRLWRYTLEYEPYDASGGLSRLARVSRVGLRDEPHPLVFDFEYSRTLGGVCEVGCDSPYLVDMGAIGVNLGNGDATLVDLNGDALPDIVDSAQPGAHRIFINQFNAIDDHRFAPLQRSETGTRASHQISSPYVQTLDVNGDARADLVNVRTGEVLFNRGDGDWSNVAPVGAGALPDFGEDFAVGAEELTHVRFFDFDNDRRIDVLRATDVATDIYRNTVDGFALAPDVEPIGAGFRDQRLELADMNGDGLLDPVIIRAGGVRYRINLGLGRWSAWRDIEDLPINAAEIEFVELEDINGDSLDDIVMVLADQLRYALNRGGDRFDTVEIVRDAGGRALPQRVDGTTVLYADMNGSGSDDIVWITAAGQVTYLELFPLRPNLLTRVTNGIGLVTDVTYSTSVQQRALDPDGWTYALPFPMLMASSIDVYDSRSGIHQRIDYRYKDPYYDAPEKATRGFAMVEMEAIGDATQQGAIERMTYDVGVEDRYRHGRKLFTETLAVTDAGLRPLHTVAMTYADCPVAEAETDGPYPVRYVCEVEMETVLQEGAPAAEWATLRESKAYDGFGNLTEQIQHGVVAIGDGGCGRCDPDADYGAPCGATCTGDELHTLRDFAVPGARWITGLPIRERISADPATGRFAEKRFFYDGPAFVGLPAGEFVAGTLTRAAERVDAERFIDVSRFRIDAHGNTVEALGPRGTVGEPGFRQISTYDAEGLLITQSERETLDADGAPYRLRQRMDYSPEWGELTSMSDWVVMRDGEAQTSEALHRIAYDALGRMRAMAAPGDDLDRPTREWIYEMGDPISRIIARRRSVAGARLPDLESISCRDGLDRTFETRVLTGRGQYEVSTHSAFNRRGRVVRSYRAHRTADGACQMGAPDGVEPALTRYDGKQRIITQIMPDAAIYGTTSQIVTAFGPLEEIEHDQADLDPASPRAQTPVIRRKDGLGRLTAVAWRTEAGAPLQEWRLGYDVYGGLASITDPGGNVRRQIRDAKGRVVEVDGPDRGRVRLTYDDDDQLIRREDAAGRVVELRYDALNRLVERIDGDDPDGSRIRFLYDDPAACSGPCDHTGNRLVRTEFPAGAHETLYDARGRERARIATIDGVDYRTDFTHDNADRLIGKRLPDGTALRYTHDASNRVIGLEGYIDRVVWDRGELLERIEFSNGVEERWLYDGLDRPADLTIVADGAPVIDLAYSYARDNLPLITTDRAPPADAPSLAAAYRYDGLNRLIEAQLDAERDAFAETIAYSFDGIDRLRARRSDRADSPVHIAALAYDDLPHAPSAVDATALRYDAAGFLVARGGDDLTWDGFGRLTGVWRGEAQRVRVHPGPDDDRVMVEQGARFTVFASDDFEIQDGMAVSQIRAGTRRIATRETDALAAQVLSDVAPAAVGATIQPRPDGIINAADALIAHRAEALPLDGPPADDPRRLLRASARRTTLEGAPRIRFLHTERYGNTALVTDDAGRVRERPVFYPSGTPRVEGGDAKAWARQETDDASGLTFFGARYYDRSLAHWTAPDPAFDVLSDEDALARTREVSGAYAFAMHNPAAFSDSGGTETFMDMLRQHAGLHTSYNVTDGSVNKQHIVETSDIPADVQGGVVTQWMEYDTQTAKAETLKQEILAIGRKHGIDSGDATNDFTSIIVNTNLNGDPYEVRSKLASYRTAKARAAHAVAKAKNLVKPRRTQTLRNAAKRTKHGAAQKLRKFGKTLRNLTSGSTAAANTTTTRERANSDSSTGGDGGGASSGGGGAAPQAAGN